jgi:arylsulfatase
LKNTFFLLLLIVIFSIFFNACSKDKQKTAQKPNIIFIMADDLGYAELGCYGQDKIKTPAIDALAENGIKFMQFYSGSPVCAPSRCVLLTGKHPGHAYIRGNDEWRERGEVWNYAKAAKDPNLEGQRPIPASTVTIGKILQKAGYKTACVGKWGLGAPLSEGAPNKQGFDFFFGYNCQRQAHNYFPPHLWENEQKVQLDNEIIAPGTKLDKGADPLDIKSYAKYTQKEYAPDLMIKETLQFIDRNKDKPFFLYFATPIPHVPLQAPKEYVQKYVKLFGDEQPYLGKKGYFPTRYPHAAYAAMISYLDDQVKQIINKLKALGIYDNTIIFFTSDNGPSYAGGSDSQFFNSAKPFKSSYGWGKGFTHEGGIRVPMIVSWPGKVKPDSKSDFIGAFWDVLPTLCDIAGAAKPDSIDGISFLPTIKGDKKQNEHNYLYWEFPSYTGQQAVRMGHWKGIRDSIFFGNRGIKLYNLNDDIQETHNIATQHPETVKK